MLDWEIIERHLEAVIVWTGRCTWRPRSSEFGDALAGRDRVELIDALGGRDRVDLEMHLEAGIELNSEMHLEAEIEWVWRCIWRPRLSWNQRCTWRPRLSGFGDAFGDAFGGRDRVTQRCTWMPWSNWTQRCTWRPRSSWFEDAFGGRDRVELSVTGVYTLSNLSKYPLILSTQVHGHRSYSFQELSSSSEVSSLLDPDSDIRCFRSSLALGHAAVPVSILIGGIQSWTLCVPFLSEGQTQRKHSPSDFLLLISLG